MNNLHLSTREQIMFDTLKKQKEVDVDDLMTALKKAGEKPRGGTRSLTVCVRYLGFKIAWRGFAIERVSGLGRGNKARYRMHKTNGRKQ